MKSSQSGGLKPDLVVPGCVTLGKLLLLSEAVIYKNGDKDNLSVVRIKLDDNNAHHSACHLRCSKIRASIPGRWCPDWCMVGNILSTTYGTVGI